MVKHYKSVYWIDQIKQSVYIYVYNIILVILTLTTFINFFNNVFCWKIPIRVNFLIVFKILTADDDAVADLKNEWAFEESGVSGDKKLMRTVKKCLV